MTERLGRYLLIRPLARGGMGEIFLAEHTGLSGFAKRVALKRIRPELSKNTHYVDLFLNEARVGSFLNHPNIVHIFDVGHEGDHLYLVMEYVDGVDLKRLCRRAQLAGHPLPGHAIAAVMVEVLKALEEAHAGGPTRGAPIIHRDLSPENVLVGLSGAVKVLDFGLAKWAPGRVAVPSMEGDMIFGKTRYMPPEQLRGELIDVRADLFALGVVMYEALRGTLPFGSGSANAVLANILLGGLRGPLEAAGRPDPDLDAIVLRALAPKPEHRFQTAAQMRHELVEYLEHTGPRMPIEQLRAMLQPQSPLSRAARKAAPDLAPTLASASASISNPIGLGVAKRCGKCGGPFEALFQEGLIVDRCSSCAGSWVDHGEVVRLLGEYSLRTSHAVSSAAPERAAPLDAVVGSCPTCRIGLRAFAVPDRPASLEICPDCFGVWFDAGEIALLERESTLTWFKTLLDSLRHTR
jgi:serine/threonine protein kinase